MANDSGDLASKEQALSVFNEILDLLNTKAKVSNCHAYMYTIIPYLSITLYPGVTYNVHIYLSVTNFCGY